MRSFTLSTLAIGAMAATASAQLTNILPTSANSVAGSSQNSFPWGTPATAWPGLRIQCIYDSSHFTGAPTPITAPILITNVRWRANDVATSWTGGTFNNASLALGTAPIDHSAASTTWANNIGPDYTTVYTGPVTLQPGTGAGTGVPGAFVVDITLTTPFLYDPSLGDLIVDTDYVTGAWSGGSQVAMDVQPTNLLARRVFSSSQYPNANGVDNSAPVIEIGYIPPGGTIATNTSLGQGCIRSYTSLYEMFGSPTTFDLSNSSMSLFPTGLGYLALSGIGTYVPPSAAAQLVAGGDNVEQTVTLSTPFSHPGGTTNTLVVCSNGYVSVAIGNGTGSSPSTATMLAFPQTAWGSWHNFNPSGGANGNVKFEEIAGVAYFTWDNVADAGAAPATSTWQLQFDTTTGLVQYVWQSMSLAGTAHLPFYSPGGPSLDPGNTDLSTSLAAGITLGTVDIAPLTLSAISRPVIGTSWSLSTNNIPATGTIGVEVFGLSDPNVNDLSFLGMPGCGLRSSLDIINAYPITAATHPYGLAIPNDPALLGVAVFTTSAVLQTPPVNAFGAITSNGMRGSIGDV